MLYKLILLITLFSGFLKADILINNGNKLAVQLTGTITDSYLATFVEQNLSSFNTYNMFVQYYQYQDQRVNINKLCIIDKTKSNNYTIFNDVLYYSKTLNRTPNIPASLTSSTSFNMLCYSYTSDSDIILYNFDTIANTDFALFYEYYFINDYINSYTKFLISEFCDIGNCGAPISECTIQDFFSEPLMLDNGNNVTTDFFKFNPFSYPFLFMQRSAVNSYVYNQFILNFNKKDYYSKDYSRVVYTQNNYDSNCKDYAYLLPNANTLVPNCTSLQALAEEACSKNIGQFLNLENFSCNSDVVPAVSTYTCSYISEQAKQNLKALVNTIKDTDVLGKNENGQLTKNGEVINGLYVDEEGNILADDGFGGKVKTGYSVSSDGKLIDNRTEEQVVKDNIEDSDLQKTEEIEDDLEELADEYKGIGQAFLIVYKEYDKRYGQGVIQKKMDASLQQIEMNFGYSFTLFGNIYELFSSNTLKTMLEPHISLIRNMLSIAAFIAGALLLFRRNN